MKKLIVIMSLLSQVIAYAFGQNRINNILLNNVVLEQKADSLYIRMDIEVDPFKIKTQKEFVFTPHITSGFKKTKLPTISIKGKAAYIAYERLSLSKGGRNKIANTDNKYILKGSRTRKQKFIYNHTILYSDWMKDAIVSLEERGCGCGKENLLATHKLHRTLILDTVIKPYKITPHLAYITPKVEPVKQRASMIECYIEFENNNSIIKHSFRNNTLELQKINKFIEQLRTDSNIAIKHINIIGYASPDGELYKNQQLSQQRANALKRYLTEQYSFDNDLYSVKFGGENWLGLVNALEATELSYKKDVLAIIKQDSIEQGREKKIMELHSGEPYRYMVQYIFPKLRIAKLKVDYSVRNFTIAQAQVVAKSKPQHLSLNELFIVANSYGQGSSEFCDLFEIAARLFPEDQTSILNAALSSLSRGDTILAERYLNKVTLKTPEYNNAMGVLLMLKGDYTKAENYLKKAQNESLIEASHNLKELYRKIELDQIIMQKRIQ